MLLYNDVNDHDDLLGVVDGILSEANLKRADAGGEVTFAGMDPIRPTKIKVGAASAAVTAANAVAAGGKLHDKQIAVYGCRKVGGEWFFISHLSVDIT